MLSREENLLKGRYRIETELGAGGMGAVYRAFDTLHEEPCALKELRLGHLPSEHKPCTPQDPDDTRIHHEHNPSTVTREKIIEQFLFEAKLLVKLDHPNLPKVRDYVAEGENYYLVMELIEGHNLAMMLASANGKPFPVKQVMGWTDQVMDALAYCHQRGVIHRDIKPSNMIITPSGKIYLVDFGVAKASFGGRALIESFTSGYSPPEQHTGKGYTDERSDIYALGATLYTLLTGREPPGAPERMNGTDIPSPRSVVPGIPSALSEAVMRAMEIEPQDRFQSVNDMRIALGRLLPRTLTPQPFTSRLRRWITPWQPPPIPLDPQAGYYPARIVADYYDNVYIAYINDQEEHGYVEKRYQTGEYTVIWSGRARPIALSVRHRPESTHIILLTWQKTAQRSQLIRIKMSENSAPDATSLWAESNPDKQIVSIATNGHDDLFGLFLSQRDKITEINRFRFDSDVWNPFLRLNIKSSVVGMAIGGYWFHILHDGGVTSIEADPTIPGQQYQTCQLASKPVCARADREGFVYVSDRENRLYAFDTKTGKNYWFKEFRRCRRFGVGSRQLYVLEEDSSHSWQLRSYRLGVLWGQAKCHILSQWNCKENKTQNNE